MANVIITLSFVHFIQLFTIYLVLLKIFPEINIVNIENPTIVVVGGLIVFGFANYLILYNKERWNKYVEEFKDESDRERLQGKVYTLCYLIGSIMLFFIVLPLLFGF